MFISDLFFVYKDAYEDKERGKRGVTKNVGLKKICCKMKLEKLSNPFEKEIATQIVCDKSRSVSEQHVTKRIGKKLPNCIRLRIQ